MAKHFTGQSECFHLCSLTWTERGTFLISGKKNKKNTWLQRDISCLTPHRQTYQSFSLSVVISVPVSAADSWETRQQPFQKVTSQHSTSSLSFTPLTAAPPPPPPPPVPLSVSLDVDNGIFCGQVTKTERMWVCVRLCVCPPPYCHRLSGPERERQSDKVTAGPYFSLPLWSSRGHKTWCDCWEGRRERKKKKTAAATSPTATLKV